MQFFFQSIYWWWTWRYIGLLQCRIWVPGSRCSWIWIYCPRKSLTHLLLFVWTVWTAAWQKEAGIQSRRFTNKKNAGIYSCEFCREVVIIRHCELCWHQWTWMYALLSKKDPNIPCSIPAEISYSARSWTVAQWSGKKYFRNSHWLRVWQSEQFHKTLSTIL